jgi:hypothetical protein
MAALPNPSPERFPVLSFVGAKADLLFWEKVDIKIQRVRDAELGEAHWDRVRYPDHRLVYKTPLDAAGQWHKYYYAADRENQDDYNWQLDGESLTRTYIISRESYLDGLGTIYGPESRTTTVGVADSFFTLYGFTHEQIQRAPDELESLYVVLTKVFQQIRKKKQFYDDELSLTITEVTEIVPRGFVSASSTPGRVTEINPVNQFYDLKVTQTIGTVADNGAITLPTYPIQLTSYIADVPYRFPLLLRGARMIGVWAYADSSKAARSYDEAWYIDWDLVDPSVGPYEARILRFLTNDPNALRSSYPIQKIVMAREDIGIARSWWNASDKGNSSYAEARQIEVPSSIHGEIIIENGETISVGQSTNKLEATPNFAQITDSMSMIVGYESKQTRYGMFIVEITELNTTGVYSGVTVPFGTPAVVGASPPNMGATISLPSNLNPDPPVGEFTDSNTIISGVAAPSSEVRAFVGFDVIGSSIADASNGSFSIVVNTVYTDPVNVSLVAVLNGRTSAPLIITSLDLAPAIPVASIPASLAFVSGTAEPNSTVSIRVNPVAQTENCSIISFRPQVETLSFSGTLVSVSPMEIGVDFTSALVNGGTLVSFVVPILVSDTMAIVAGKVKSQLQTNAQILANYNLDVVGNDLVVTAKVSAADDATLVLSILDPNSTGITVVSSTDTVIGNTVAVTATSTGLAKATVISSIPGISNVVQFSVVSGDTTSDVASKASAALNLSTVANQYTASASTNTVTLTANSVSPNDALLSLVIENDTCTGLISSTSVNGTTSGAAATVIANAAGSFSYPFNPILTGTNIVHLTASDAGGTSGTLVLKTSATPPSLATAIYSDSDTITGTGTVGAKVTAYVDDANVGEAIISGGGTFTLNTNYKLIRGEVVKVVASNAADPLIRSAAKLVTFASLNLEVPQFSLTSSGYVGVKPATASSIVIRNVTTSSETFATLQSNGNFSFTLPASPAGTQFDVFARYPEGDSDAVRIPVTFLRFRQPYFDLYQGSKAGISLGTEPKGVNQFYYSALASIYWHQMAVVIEMDEGSIWPSAGIGVKISFPGTNIANIELASVQNGQRYNNPLLTVVSSTPIPGRANGPAFAYYFQWAAGFGVLPANVIKVEFSFPDGGKRFATFDRATYSNSWFKNGNWLITQPIVGAPALDWYISRYSL